MNRTAQENTEKDAFSRLFLGEMKICIHRMEGNIPVGSIYSCYIHNTLEFHGIADMILKIDALCNCLDAPKAEAERRSIGIHQENQQFGKKPIQCYHTYKEFSANRGAVTSFYIRLRFRRNVSWQGSIRFAKDGELYQFRSVLELMGYLDERIGLKSVKREGQ